MPNHLASQHSTYLLAHADQPVDWYPWGPEALDKARREDKPILLSIGYAACHWCHVMAKETFSDPATAAMLNEGFVNIKVDREERPDLDQVYQLAHQMLRRTGGGWPLNIFLSPQGLPFYSGTYFPAVAQAGQASFRDVLGSVSTVWHDQRPALIKQDKAILDAFAAQAPHVDDKAVLDAKVRDHALQQLTVAFDSKHGGFGGEPKFPHPTDLAFLLKRGRDEGDEKAGLMALFTLRKMAEGGLYDQIGGGFFRYSVDGQWRIPHFEKMLCDNGQLLALYADAYAMTGDPLFAQVIDNTVAWVVRDMQAESGAFLASTPADDTKGVEGGHYVWESEALRAALKPNEWDVCAAHWGLIDPPNFEGRYWHLYSARSAASLARTLKYPIELVEGLIASARTKLLTERDKRERNLPDQQYLTSWMALMITGLARAAAVCQQADWLVVARKALTFIQTQRLTLEGRLLTLPDQDGFLDDHAFLLEAILALHEADPQAEDLPFAQRIADALLSQFEDPVQGAFFIARHDAPPLFYRIKPALDAATPSGNGTAALALLDLAKHSPADSGYAQAAQRCIETMAATVCQDPASHTRLLLAAQRLAG